MEILPVERRATNHRAGIGAEVSPERRCGDCTACCSGVLRIESAEISVGPGRPCRHCGEAGCGIYQSRPDVCRQFVCGWLVGSSPLPNWMRPDCSGVIVLAAERHWRGLAVDVALATSRGPRKNAIRWLLDFSAAHGRPLLYQEEVDGPWIVYGPTEFRDAIGRLKKQNLPLFGGP